MVIDTANFSNSTLFRGASVGLHVVERLKLTEPDMLAYRFIIEDTDTFSRSWVAESVFTRTADKMFEFACHEANYSVLNTLRGARYSEKLDAIK